MKVDIPWPKARVPAEENGRSCDSVVSQRSRPGAVIYPGKDEEEDLWERPFHFGPEVERRGEGEKKEGDREGGSELKPVSCSRR